MCIACVRENAEFYEKNAIYSPLLEMNSSLSNSMGEIPADLFSNAIYTPVSSVTERDMSTMSTLLNGTSGNDRLVGTNKDDTINGLAGNDIIIGLAGNDTLR